MSARSVTEEAQHAGKVLRLKTGDEVECFDGRGHAWLCSLRFDGARATVCAREPLASNESPIRLTLYQGLPKLDKLDLIVQKATELGAWRIVPVGMARSVARVDGRDAERKRERWQRIAVEAAKQCGRALVPEVALPVRFDKVTADMAARELMLMPYETASGQGPECDSAGRARYRRADWPGGRHSPGGSAGRRRRWARCR